MDIVSEVMLRSIRVALGIFIGLLLIYLLDRYWDWKLDRKIKSKEKSK